MLSPCVKICKLVDKKCVACKRTIYEIQNWAKFSYQQRKKIMKVLDFRK